jgi:hypothetical protein
MNSSEPATLAQQEVMICDVSIHFRLILRFVPDQVEAHRLTFEELTIAQGQKCILSSDTRITEIVKVSKVKGKGTCVNVKFYVMFYN